jgi:hypothetical protein
VHISWHDNSANETGFIIERSPDGISNWLSVGLTGPNNISFEDTTSLPCRNYYYRVYSYWGPRNSFESNTATLYTTINPPSQLSTTCLSPGNIQISWHDNSTHEIGYIIERKNSYYASWSALGTTGPNANSFLDSAAIPNTHYYYQVCAMGDFCNSVFSETSWANYGSSPRLVLNETFTGENCPPSSILDPKLDSILNLNSSKVIGLKYFLPYNWGNSGPFPFYYDDQPEVDNRNIYYNCFSIPQGYMDGAFSFSGSNSSLPQIQSDIDMYHNSLSPFIINVTHTVSSGQDSIYVHVVIHATDSVSGNLIGRIAVMERFLDFQTPPGSNGETHFEGMMKKMLPDADGTVLQTIYAPGDSTVLDFSWQLAHIYDINSLAAVAFVQDDSTGYIYQAGYSAPVWVTGISENKPAANSFVYPNPFSSNAVIQFNSETVLQNALVKLTDVNGNEVEIQPMTGNRAFINRENLSSGIYFYQIVNDKEIFATGKLIVN